MSLLEALVEVVFTPQRMRDVETCETCGGQEARDDWVAGYPFPHASECFWAVRFRVIAALEAAEAYLAPAAEGGGSLQRLQALDDALGETGARLTGTTP